jgi:hypothetical protein
MQSKAKTPQEYLASLPEDRRAAIATVRQVILDNVTSDVEEGMQYGMLGYYIPHRVFPAGYHCDPKQPLPYINLASQKNHMAVYLFCYYFEGREWLEKQWAKAGKKLDAGAGCFRFKKIEDLPLDVLAAAIQRVPAERFIAGYQKVLDDMAAAKQAKKAAQKAVAKKPAAKKPVAKKAAAKKSPAKKAAKR